MNNVLDKFIDDLEKNLAANKASQKAGTVSISLADYEALVATRTLFGVLQNAFAALPNYDFERLAGVILGVKAVEPPKAFGLEESFMPDNTATPKEQE